MVAKRSGLEEQQLSRLEVKMMTNTICCGIIYNLLFGDDGATAHPHYMAAEEEVLVSQNAPSNILYDEGWPNDLHDFPSL